MMKNKCYIASAGSGKTTLLVKQALQTAERTRKKVAIVTYTSRNQEEIIKKIHEKRTVIPSNVLILGWYEFLIKYWIRPYKGDVLPELYDIPISLYYDPTITDSIVTGHGKHRSRHNGNQRKKYFSLGCKLYSNYVSDFALKCHNKNNPGLINRLYLIFEHLYFDEAQDFVGYDFDVIKLLLKGPIKCTIALDPRQHTFSTAITNKYDNYCGKLDIFIKEKVDTKRKRYVDFDDHFLSHSHRCNKSICELASKIDGVYQPTIPCQCDDCNKRRNTYPFEQGVFWVKESNVNEFISHYKSTTLRWDARAKLSQHLHLSIMNFGECKGLSFDACIIKPTTPYLKCLKTGIFNLSRTSQAKFYVAVTRARYVVGIIVPDNWTSKMQFPFWEPS